MRLGLRALRTRLDGALTDLRLGIRTEAQRPSPDPTKRNESYEALPYEALRPMSRAAACKPTDRLVDLGCGKGRVVCWFARESVAICRGVDIDPELTEAARRNAERLRGSKAPIEIVCADATEANLDDATVVTMYNPFGAEVMSEVGRRLAESVAKAPRPLRVVYANPVHLKALTDQGWEVRSRIHAPYFGGRMEVAVLASAGETAKSAGGSARK